MFLFVPLHDIAIPIAIAILRHPNPLPNLFYSRSAISLP